MPSWDEAADWYLEMVRNDDVGFNRLAADVAVGLLGPVAGLDVLDVGCGEGHLSRRLASAGARVVAVEPVERLLQAALAHEEPDQLGIAYRLDRAEELASVEDGSFDAAVVGDYAREGYWTEGDTSADADVRSIRQIGWYHRTIATFVSDVAQAGFRVESIAEPYGREPGRADGGGPWANVPRFLALSAQVGHP